MDFNPRATTVQIVIVLVVLSHNRHPRRSIDAPRCSFSVASSVTDTIDIITTIVLRLPSHARYDAGSMLVEGGTAGPDAEWCNDGPRAAVWTSGGTRPVSTS